MKLGTPPIFLPPCSYHCLRFTMSCNPVGKGIDANATIFPCPHSLAKNVFHRELD